MADMNPTDTPQKDLSPPFQVSVFRMTNPSEGWERVHSNPTTTEEEDSQTHLLTVCLTAMPMFVAADFLALTDVAHASFQPEPLLATDLVAPTGYGVLETPKLITADLSDLRANLEAEGHDEQTIVQSTQPMYMHSFLWATDSDDLGTAQRVRFFWFCSFRGRLCMEAGFEWNLGELEPHDQRHDIPSASKALIPWFQTLLRLIQQGVGVTTVATQPPRAVRRRMARAGLPTTVNIVDLPRRQYSANGQGLGSFTYSQRWMVAGHWRNQWYPSLQAHRQKWINGYVKGPAGMPLVAKTRVGNVRP